MCEELTKHGHEMRVERLGLSLVHRGHETRDDTRIWQTGAAHASLSRCREPIVVGGRKVAFVGRGRFAQPGGGQVVARAVEIRVAFVGIAIGNARVHSRTIRDATDGAELSSHRMHEPRNRDEICQDD